MNEKYDIVGDIHGHAAKLQRLLRRLGYEERDGIYRHASRQLIFVGDFIDRGPEIRRTLQIARAMVDAGTARAVMGNHEFNALLYHTKGPDGKWLRPHDEKNTCPASGDAGSNCAIMTRSNGKTGWIGCWSCRFGWTWARAALCTRHGTMLLVQACGTQDTLARESLLPKPEDRQTPEGSAVNWLLKGPEYKLGDGTLFVDKEGFTRTSVRAKWWIPIRPGMTHAEAAMPAGEIRGEGCVPDGVSFPGYGEEAPALFFGHYWLAPEEHQGPSGFKHRVPGLQRRQRRSSGRLSIRRRSNSEAGQIRGGRIILSDRCFRLNYLAVVRVTAACFSRSRACIAQPARHCRSRSNSSSRRLTVLQRSRTPVRARRV